MRCKTFRVCLSRGWSRVLCTVSSLLLPLFVSAQSTVTYSGNKELKAGDVIYGKVFDENGPIRHVSVYEMDSSGLINAMDMTDENGEFNFSLINPQDSLKMEHAGYFTVKHAITADHISIMLAKNPQDMIYNTYVLYGSPLMDKISTTVEIDSLLAGRTVVYGPPTVDSNANPLTRRQIRWIKFKRKVRRVFGR